MTTFEITTFCENSHSVIKRGAYRFYTVVAVSLYEAITMVENGMIGANEYIVSVRRCG